MIHFITWLPLPYQQVLCRTLHEYYGSNFVVWYGETRREEFPFAVDLSGSFEKHFLDQCVEEIAKTKAGRDLIKQRTVLSVAE